MVLKFDNLIQYGQTLKAIQGIKLSDNMSTKAQIESMYMLTNAVSNLTPKQQALALTTKELSVESIKNALVLNGVSEEEATQAAIEAGLIKKKKELSIAIAQETLTQALGNKEKAKSIMKSAGIVASDGAETVAKKKVSVATLETKLSQEGLSKTQIKLITTQMGLSTSTATLSNYFKGLAASTWASVKAIGVFLVTNPVGWCVAAATAIAGVVLGVNAYNKAINEGIEKANEAYDKTAESISGLEEYKNKIIELKNALKDETISEEDAYNARKQLLSIQDEIVSKYGLQKESIDLVNGSLREEIALLDEATEKEAKKFLRENQKDINNAKKKVETEKKFSLGYNQTSNIFADTSDLGSQLVANGFLNLSKNKRGTYSYSTLFEGTTEEAIEYYNKFYDFVSEYEQKNRNALAQTEHGAENVQKLLTKISEKIKDIDDDDYKNAKQLYDSAVQSKLESDENYKDIYNATIDAREAYREAISKGGDNEDSINQSLEDMKKAKENFQKAVESGKISDLGISNWFDNYYKDFEAESGKHQFKVDITANTNGLKDSVQEALNYFGNKTPTKLDILNLEVEGSEEAQTAFQSLKSLADQYGMTIEKDLIPILEDLKIVQIDEKDVDVTAGIVSSVKSNLTKLKSEIDDIFKNTDLFDKAIESLNKGEAIDFDSVMSMIEVDSSLADKFVQTADGYTIGVDKLIEARQKYTEETKTSTQADIEASKQAIKIAEQNIKSLEAKRDALKNTALFDHGTYTENDIKAVEKYNAAIQSEKDHIEELSQTISENTLILGEMTKGVSNAESSIEKLSATLEKASKKQSVLKSAMEDMADTGYISASTYAELVELGGNFADCLEIQDGRFTLNIEKLKELEKQEYLNVVAANNLRIAELQLAKDGIKSDPTGYLTRILDDKINELNEQNALYNTLAEETGNVKPSGSSSSKDKPKSVLDYEEWVAKQEHKIAMGQLKEDEAYYDEKLRRAKIAYSGLADYKDDLWKVQEEHYKWQNQQEDKLFDKKIDNLDKLKDKALENNDFDNARSQVKTAISTTQSRISELQSSGRVDVDDEIEELREQLESLNKELDEIDNKEISFRTDKLDDVLDDLDEYAEKLDKTFTTSDGTKLTTQEKWQAIVDVYKEAQIRIQEEIDRILDMGIEGHEEQVKQLEEKIEEYGNKISDTFKSAVEAEKSLLENQKSALFDIYDKQIDKIKKQQDEAKKAADAEIDLIKEKIDNLKKVNNEKQQEYDIEKAKQDLEKSKQKTRMVYGADGTVSYRQDDEKIAEAQQNLDKLLLEKQVNTLETQKSLLEDMRDKESESYDKLIEDIESQKEQDERQFDILIQRLDDYLNPNSDTSNSDVWSEIAKMDGASYRNGKWIDKDGTEIDVTALLAKASEKNTKSNNDTTVNKKTENEDKTQTNKSDVKKSDTETDKAKEIEKEESQTEKVNSQLETAADIIGKIAVSADDFVSTILKTLGATSVKDLWTKSSNGIPNGNQVLSSQHDTSKWTASRDNYVTNNTNQPVNMTFGDINVNNPVGDAKQLAEEVKGKIFRDAMMQIPNDAMKIIHKN